MTREYSRIILSIKMLHFTKNEGEISFIDTNQLLLCRLWNTSKQESQVPSFTNYIF
jgi:hypothetical protein